MRTRTRPDLKWLLVERATIAGDIARLEARQASLAEQIGERCAALQALDTAIRLTEERVAPTAAGVIRRHTKEYGKRGALKQFLIATLRAAPMEALSMDAIALKAASHFGLEFVTEADFTAFVRNSVRQQVWRLKEDGLVEMLYHHPKKGKPGLWRWKSQLPTLSELAAPAMPE